MKIIDFNDESSFKEVILYMNFIHLKSSQSCKKGSSCCKNLTKTYFILQKRKEAKEKVSNFFPQQREFSFFVVNLILNSPICVSHVLIH